MKNRLYFHVYSCNDYVNVIVSEMLNRIETFGLAENCDCLNFCILGDENYLNINFPKNSKIHINKNPYELDTIHLIWKECQEEDMKVCYVHTKGITKWDWICVEDWRKYMSYFIIDKWEDRVNDLKACDCVGVNLQGSRECYSKNYGVWGSEGDWPLHYSGNFWWSKSSHIKKIKNINEWHPEMQDEKRRILPEMWLCQSEDSKYNCVWNSNVNHYGYRYTEENYIERK